MRGSTFKQLITGWRKKTFLNPASLIYVFIRLYTRALIGRRRRGRVLNELGLGRFDGFLKKIFPHQIVLSLTIREAISAVKRSYFRHEPHVSNMLLRTKGDLFVDVGASHGYYFFLLHDNYQKIIAIEPHPENIQVMKCIKQKYGYNKVNILELAVSNRNRKVKLFIGKHSGGHSLVKYPIANDNYILVKSKTLSSIIGKRNVDLVKVDVEGVEWMVLRGAEPVVGNIKSWIVELHNPKRKEELEYWFITHDYMIRWLDSKHVYAWRKQI